jgi:hypothetical protein
MNGANGISDIEGKAAQGRGERVGETSEFQTQMKKEQESKSAPSRVHLRLCLTS